MTTGDILLVDDDPAAIRVMARVLDALTPMRFATNGREALRLIERRAPDLILLDAEMPDMNGLQICAQLKSNPSLANVPVIFVSGHISADFVAAGFEIGAAGFIAKPFSPWHAFERVQSQLISKRAADAFRSTVPLDGASGAVGRRAFDDALAREWLRGRLFGSPVGLLLIEVDHFDAFVDRYGVGAGDDCLNFVARELSVQSDVHRTRAVARMGREEFAVLLPQTTRDSAVDVAYEVLEAIEALAIPHAGSANGAHVSVSIGIAVCDEFGGWRRAPSLQVPLDPLDHLDCSADVLIETASKARYAAKLAGRGQARLLDIPIPDRVHRGHGVAAMALRP